MYQSSLQAVQLSLLEQEFDLSEEKMRFGEEFLVNGEDGTAAMLTVRPHLKPASAAVKATEWLGTRRAIKGRERKAEGDPELLRFLDWKRLQIRLRAELTEDELVAMNRRNYLHAVGDAPVRKTVTLKTGQMVDVDVREPNIPAANTAAENLRKLGGFGKDLKSERDGTPELTRTERAARLAALLDRARRSRDMGAGDAA